MELLRKSVLGKYIKSLTFGIIILFLFLIILFPIYWMIANSFKNQVEISAYPPKFLFTLTLNNYKEIFNTTDILKNALNSLIITLGSLIIALIIGLPAAYAIARYKLSKIALVILLVRMFPFISFLIPWFRIFQSIGLIDTYLALIASHLVIVLPLIVWITLSFFEDIPTSYEEAALIDGCGSFWVFFRIALPLASPGIIGASIIASILSWNNLIFALVLGGHNTKTLPLAIQQFMSFEELQWGQLNASVVLISLPIIIIVLFMQKYLTKGLNVGGLKG